MYRYYNAAPPLLFVPIVYLIPDINHVVLKHHHHVDPLSAFVYTLRFVCILYYPPFPTAVYRMIMMPYTADRSLAIHDNKPSSKTPAGHSR